MATQKTNLNIVPVLWIKTTKPEPPAPRRRKNSEPPYLTLDEVARLFKAIDSPRDRAIFRLAYHAGLRASEVGMLEMRDYDDKTDRIKVHRLKGSNSGDHHLCREEQRALRAWLKLRGPRAGIIFVSRQHGPIDRTTLDKLMKHYGALAEIPEKCRHFHVLKHSCATHLLAKGYHVEQVQDWIGHANIQNTMIYAHITNARRTEMAARVPSLGWPAAPEPAAGAAKRSGRVRQDRVQTSRASPRDTKDHRTYVFHDHSEHMRESDVDLPQRSSPFPSFLKKVNRTGGAILTASTLLWQSWLHEGPQAISSPESPWCAARCLIGFDSPERGITRIHPSWGCTPRWSVTHGALPTLPRQRRLVGRGRRRGVSSACHMPAGCRSQGVVSSPAVAKRDACIYRIRVG
jgi:hypothetical protein